MAPPELASIAGRSRTRGVLAAAFVFLCSRPVLANDAASWPDSFVARVEILALIEQLNGELLAGRSATATLEAWCADHHMAAPARLVAMPDREADKPASAGDRVALGASADEPLRYRHVRLACGAHVLSDAENWYVPSRLTADMNRRLETTDTPFGRVVQDLHPVRQTLSVERLWSPLPRGWERTPISAAMLWPRSDRLAIPPYLFRHRAVLFGPDRRPIALVVENYRSEVLRYPR